MSQASVSAAPNSFVDRRDPNQSEERLLGKVINCDGARAVIAAIASQEDGEVLPGCSIGRMISIQSPNGRVIGLVFNIDVPGQRWSENGDNLVHIHVELLGEARDHPNGELTFDRGITAYPNIGANVHQVRSSDLVAAYKVNSDTMVEIGTLTQDPSIKAAVSVFDTLDRHFAIVGSTGVGKSTATSLFLHKAVEVIPNQRVIILDPHNEFASAFNAKGITVDENSLYLPYWLFEFEEFVEVVFRGRKPLGEEIDILRDLIPMAKQAFAEGKDRVIRRRGGLGQQYTVDAPLPYRFGDLTALIEERMGMLDAKQERSVLKALKSRLESLANDPNFTFMFENNTVTDSFVRVVGHIFRVPDQGRRISCIQLGGIPSEVVNSVASVLARLAFQLCVACAGKVRIAFVCEEAHRYMPADKDKGFAPTRMALGRIAKEGRKYGCSLGVITQRPGELDPTVLSQCSTVFAMRLANEADRGIIRSAIAESSASFLSFLSSMGQREAIAFGEGIATPMRMKFEQLASELIPNSDWSADDSPAPATIEDLQAAAMHMRNQRMDSDMPGNDSALPQQETASPGQEAQPMLRPLQPQQAPMQRVGSQAPAAANPAPHRQPIAPETRSPAPQQSATPGYASSVQRQNPQRFGQTRFGSK